MVHVALRHFSLRLLLSLIPITPHVFVQVSLHVALWHSQPSPPPLSSSSYSHDPDPVQVALHVALWHSQPLPPPLSSSSTQDAVHVLALWHSQPPPPPLSPSLLYKAHILHISHVQTQLRPVNARHKRMDFLSCQIYEVCHPMHHHLFFLLLLSFSSLSLWIPIPAFFVGMFAEKYDTIVSLILRNSCSQVLWNSFIIGSVLVAGLLYEENVCGLLAQSGARVHGPKCNH